MALSERRHLGRQEESVNETGVQMRATDPVSPVSDQTWINTSQNKMKYFDGDSVVVLHEGHMGAAIEVPVSGIVDAVASRSWFKDVNADYTINAFNNFPEGLNMYLRMRNTAPDIKEVTAITLPAPSSFANGSYFLLNGANNTNKYYVWADFDSFGVDPAIGGRTGVRVLTSAGLKETTDITCPGGATITSGQYFFINSALDVNQYYVWFNTGLGGDPLLGGKTGIQVVISSSDTAEQVATKLKDALSLTPGLTATVLSNIVTVVNSVVGTCTDASNLNVSGLTITVTQQGKVADTAAEFATKAALALDALADFVCPAPGSNIITVTNANFGFTDDAQDGNFGVGLTIAITTQGSGRIRVTFPVNAAVDESASGIVEGGKEKIFRMFRSGSLIYIIPNGTFPL